MRDCVHASGGRQHWRQTHREFRIANGSLRYQVGEIKSELAAILERDQRRPANLTARAGCGGDSDQGATAALIFGMPPKMAAYCSKGPLWLESRATPFARSIGEPPPMAIRPSQPLDRIMSRADRTAASVGFVGVSVKTGTSCPSGREFLEAVDKTNARDAGIGHDQRSLDVEFAQIVPQPSQGTEVEPDGGQV